jgi:thiol-disulfide isomerase/thioredoxin
VLRHHAAVSVISLRALLRAVLSLSSRQCKRLRSAPACAKMRRRAALPLLCLALLALLARPAAAGGHAVAVDDANFDALVLASAEAWVLEFASPRCGTCQELAPLYAQLAAKNNAVARFGAVDIDTPGGMALAQRLEILEEGVPNVRAYVRAGDAAGARVFSGWQVPPAAELEAALLAALRQAVPQARCGGGLRAGKRCCAQESAALRGQRRLS